MIYILILVLIANATTVIQEKAILYSRSVILGLLCIAYIACNNLHINFLSNSLGLYNGLFNVTMLSQSFNLFILLLASLIGILTSIYPNKISNYLNRKNDSNILNISNKIFLVNTLNNLL